MLRKRLTDEKAHRMKAGEPMTVFNEYERKNTNVRVRITYERTSQKRMNPWEISSFISKITTYMYKVEVINTIAAAISSGVEKKNIFVLDRAYRLNEDYTGCASLDLNTAAFNKVYLMGKPEGMEPNEDLITLKLLLGLIYDANQLLRANRARQLSGWHRMDIYRCLTEQGFWEAVKYTTDMMEESLWYQDDIKGREKNREKIDLMRRRAKEEFERYLADRQYFAVVEEKLNTKGGERLSERETEIVSRYYKKFYQTVADSVRPIVGIYDEERRVMQLLCADHFDAALNRHTRIDLKRITQNSPILGEVEAGCQILALGEEEKRKKELFELEKKNALLTQENLRLEHENLLLQREKLRREINIAKNEEIRSSLDVKSSALEVRRRANELADDAEKHGIKSIEDSYAAQQLGDIYGKVQKGYSNTLYKNKFQETQISFIDVKA